MLNFKTFLLETKIAQSKLNDVVEIFKRILERESGEKLYRFGGAKGYTQIKNGIGILYFYARSKKGIRFNYINGEIASITLWNRYVLNQPGNYTISLDGMNLLYTGKKLIELIKHPTVGSIPTFETLDEEYLGESKRVSPDDFHRMAINHIGKYSDLTWNQILEIGIINDVQIPSVIRSAVSGGTGKNKKYDLSLVTKKKDHDKIQAANDPIYYIKITAQDPTTSKFQSVKDDVVAQRMLSQIQTSLAHPDYAKESNNPDSLFGKLSSLVKLVARGNRNSLIIYGGPGTGKTYTVTQTLNTEGLSRDKQWYVIKGKITTASLYQTLFMHRKDGILVFDDTDSVWNDAEAANLLKAALDSYDERMISWNSARTLNVQKMDKSQRLEVEARVDESLKNADSGSIKFPSEFLYNGRIIFISNLPESKFDSAVLSRSAKIDMTLTVEQIFYRMKTLIEMGTLGSTDVPVHEKLEILAFLKVELMRGTIREATLRQFVNAEDVYRSGLPDWKELLPHI